jgi:hypothetical protein
MEKPFVAGSTEVIRELRLVERRPDSPRPFEAALRSVDFVIWEIRYTFRTLNAQ